MDEKEKKFPIGIGQIRWGYLNLSIKQAEKIAKHEHNQDFHTRNAILSTWEKWDYELSVFNEILNKDQLALYLEERDRKLKDYEVDLIEDDNSEQKEIEFKTEEIRYLENEFLPAVLKHFHTGIFMIHPYKTKYDFLKAEYKSYLDERNREIIGSHFRHSRTFQPNTLKKKLLQHKIDAMYPDSLEFKNIMDEATNAAADYLKSHFRMLDYGNESIKPIVDALYAFRKKTADDYHEYVRSEKGGFYAFTNIDDKRSEGEKNDDLYFALLLIDRDYYGYK